MPRLQVLNGKRQGATFDIGRGECVVGHRNTANVAIDDPWVSWDHARIFTQGAEFWVEDLGSTNGTYVNCVRVKRERLNNEDIIFFGKTHVIFLVTEQMPKGAPGSEPSRGKAKPQGEALKERSDFELNVEALAKAAEQWAQPKGRRGANGGRRAPGDESPEGSVGPAIPVPAEELTDPLGLAGLPLRPLPDASDSSPRFPDQQSGRPDPFRPGADPAWASPRGSSAAEKRRGLDPNADPFDSARAGAAPDPFSAGVDPFAAPRGPRSFAETHHDEDRRAVAARLPGRGLEGFQIDSADQDGDPVPPASAAEVERLLNREQSSEQLDDLRDLLGDGAARTPAPFQPVRKKSGNRNPTDPDPDSWARAAVEPAPPPSPPLTPAVPQGPPQNQGSTWTAPPGHYAEPAPADATASKGDLAFEVAKLRDESRRIRMALDAAKEADPEKVRVAVTALRDQELGRQAREIADLRRDLASLQEEMGKRQAELDMVTEEMIEKEDTIEALRARLEAIDPTFKRDEKPDGSPRSPSPPPRALARGEANEDLTSLEF